MWARTLEDKANLLKDTFTNKWHLPEAVENEYSALPSALVPPETFVPVRWRAAYTVLRQLARQSATGPDFLPTYILKMLSREIASPFSKLARRIIATGTWPSLWRVHWVCPIHQKRSKAQPEHYRGVQLTSQLSKAMERLLHKLFFPQLITAGAFGENQFAYTSARGARDALLYLVLRCLLAFARGCRVGLYCSDVSGAFDKVPSERLLRKVELWMPKPALGRILRSWLQRRRGRIVVGGTFSEEFL